MISIIVSGHGEFASALEKTMEYIIGPQENVYFIDFNHGMGNHELEKKMEETLSQMEEGEVLFLTDIPGGTPFSTAGILSEKQKKSKVFGGTNIPLLFAALELREEGELENVVFEILEEAKNNIVIFPSENEKENAEQKYEEEDGI